MEQEKWGVPDLIVSSPLQRAQKTAVPFKTAHKDIPYHAVPQLSEMRFGSWDNQKVHDKTLSAPRAPVLLSNEHFLVLFQDSSSNMHASPYTITNFVLVLRVNWPSRTTITVAQSESPSIF